MYALTPEDWIKNKTARKGGFVFSRLRVLDHFDVDSDS